MISKASRKKRIRYLVTSLIIPLLILFVIVFIGLKNYSYLFTWKDDVKQEDLAQGGKITTPNEEQPVENETPGVKDPNENIEKEPEKPVTPPRGESKQNNPTTPETPVNWWKYPAVIKETIKSGDDLLVLVNKEYKLPSTYAPKDLVYANTAGIRVTTTKSYMLRSIVIADLKELNTVAKEAGLDLSIISGYRSYAAQSSTYTYWVNYNNGNYDAVDQISARAGHSQHQLGTAMDFSSSEIGDRLGDEFTNTKAAKWLAENAWKYGFVISYPKGSESITGYQYESWHYRYIGKANAKEVHDSRIILENWLKTKN